VREGTEPRPRRPCRPCRKQPVLYRLSAARSRRCCRHFAVPAVFRPGLFSAASAPAQYEPARPRPCRPLPPERPAAFENDRAPDTLRRAILRQTANIFLQAMPPRRLYASKAAMPPVRSWQRLHVCRRRFARFRLSQEGAIACNPAALQEAASVPRLTGIACCHAMPGRHSSSLPAGCHSVRRSLPEEQAAASLMHAPASAAERKSFSLYAALMPESAAESSRPRGRVRRFTSLLFRPASPAPHDSISNSPLLLFFARKCLRGLMMQSCASRSTRQVSDIERSVCR